MCLGEAAQSQDEDIVLQASQQEVCHMYINILFVLNGNIC